MSISLAMGRQAVSAPVALARPVPLEIRET